MENGRPSISPEFARCRRRGWRFISTGEIVVAGAIAARPGYGGHTWALLQYVLGLRQLGWRVLFLDEIEPGQCIDARGRTVPIEHSINLRYFRRVMARFAPGDAALIDRATGRTYGLSRDAIRERTRGATFLLNIMGYLRDEEVLAAASRRLFLDIDPGFPQVWSALGLADLLSGYDAYATVGENIGQPHCTVPTGGIAWIPTRPPVVLSHWPVQPLLAPDRFTSVASWRGPFGPLTYAGGTYGLRVHAFREFLPLPRRCDASFELALDIHPAESRDLDALHAQGWTLVNPRRVANDPWRYRGYVQRSSAEFMVAKQAYVAMRTGWLSDRSVCYLASGRPVLAQDTGFAARYPVGIGLVPFATLAEAQDGVASIRAQYAHHASAARALAEEYFDARKVLARLVERVT